jgi:hypothetical protein
MLFVCKRCAVRFTTHPGSDLLYSELVVELLGDIVNAKTLLFRHAGHAIHPVRQRALQTVT